MHSFAQCAGPLAVNHPHAENLLFPANPEIFRQQLTHLGWSESVKINLITDRNLNRFFLVHATIQPENRPI